MSVVARLRVPAERFVLGEVLEVREGVRVRLESVVPTGGSTIPYLWVPEGDADAVEDALRRSPLVERVRVVDDEGPETLFRVEWSPDVNGLVDLITRSEGALLEAEGTGDDWEFRMRFPERRHLSAFYRVCVEQGLEPELEEVHGSVGSVAEDDPVLTEEQREALLVALEGGYFDVPRGVTLVELARRLGISDTAASQRIRRGLNSLLSATLARQSTESRPDEDGGEGDDD